MILYCCADLLWATKIKSTAEALGIAARPVRNVEMLAARLGDSDVRGLLVDTEAGEVALELIRCLRDPTWAASRGLQDPGLPSRGLQNPQIPSRGLQPARKGGLSPAQAEACASDLTRSGLPIIAFGPHVDVDALAAAKAAGASAVMARGALDRMLPEVLKQMAGGTPAPPESKTRA